MKVFSPTFLFVIYLLYINQYNIMKKRSNKNINKLLCEIDMSCKKILNKLQEEKSLYDSPLFYRWNWDAIVSYARTMVKTGHHFREIFDAWHFSEGFYAVKLKDKWNFISKDGDWLSNQWFDAVRPFKDGVAWVMLDNKRNYIKTDGTILSKTWFDSADGEFRTYFKYHYALVTLNDKQNVLMINGGLLSKEWLDGVWDFSEGLARIKLNDKYNFITFTGHIVSRRWFDQAYEFRLCAARVRIGDDWYDMDRDGGLNYSHSGWTNPFPSRPNYDRISIANQIKW